MNRITRDELRTLLDAGLPLAGTRAGAAAR